MSQLRKIIERIMIFVIGVPGIFASIFIIEEPKHLVYNIVVIVFSAFATVELSSMLRNKNIEIPKIEAFILGLLAPVTATLVISLDFPKIIFEATLILGGIWVVASTAFTSINKMEKAASNLIGRLTLIVYPGLFMHWLVRINEFGSTQRTSFAIFLFMFIIFLNDSAGWLFGSLFGKNNKGIIAASPNKSIAGFTGGIASSLLIGLLCVKFFPEMFPNPRLPLSFAVCIMCIITGIAGTIGDLAESAVKRSCDSKDSGTAIMGRGGFLDSIDSIALAAPVYYYINVFLFNL